MAKRLYDGYRNVGTGLHKKNRLNYDIEAAFKIEHNRDDTEIAIF